MNRGIMVTRDDPGIDELVLSARLLHTMIYLWNLIMHLCFFLCRGICSSSDSDEVCKRLECFFEPFAEAYYEICQEQINDGKEFFGLRDFYR